MLSVIFVIWQVKECIGKIIQTPTGTFQTFGRDVDNTSYSVTVCYPDYLAKVKIPRISVKDENNKWHYICKSEIWNCISEKFVYKHKENNNTEACGTFPINGKQIRIEPSNKVYRNIIIYIHETGSFHSMFRLGIPKAAFMVQTNMLLKNDIFKQMPTKDCTETDSETYDSCINNFLKEKMNKSVGCILKNTW